MNYCPTEPLKDDFSSKLLKTNEPAVTTNEVNGASKQESSSGHWFAPPLSLFKRNEFQSIAHKSSAGSQRM